MHSTPLSAPGWAAADPLVRDAVPALARGNNLVVVAPPAPVYATPVLWGMLQHRLDTGKDIMVLAPTASLEEWGGLIASLAGDVHPAPLLALGTRMAEQRLRTEMGAGVLVTSAATALLLRERSLLIPDRIGAVLIAWPETWEDQETLALVLQDVSHDAQRVILTTDPAGVGALVERHAWRAMTIPAPVPSIPVSAHPVQIVPVAWSRRAASLPGLAERLGADSLAIWAADDSHAEAIRRATAGLGARVTVTTDPTTNAGGIIAFDPPAAAQFSLMTGTAAVALLAPPGTERWLARLAPAAKPLVVSGPADRSRTALDGRRATIDQAVREGDLDPGFAALGPLFEQHDPATVAAALYHLWRQAERQAERPATPTPRAAAPALATTRIWVGAGRKDEVNVSDLVGLLANEIKVDRGSIGRVDLRETFSLIEVPASDAERIADAMTGRSIRKRRLIARVDRKTKA